MCHYKLHGCDVFDAVPDNAVNHRGDTADLSRFPNVTFIKLNAIHVLEHFDFKGQLAEVLKESHRALQPGARST